MADGKFPKDFLWGASTSAHQVEGTTTNQWSVWEQTHAEQLAASAEATVLEQRKYGYNVDWDSIKDEAQCPENYISGAGVEHYTRYAEDFALLKSLNMNAFRFSIEWSRIQPSENSWDQEELAHYHRYIAEMQRLGIAPVLTLWHWTMPLWFTDKGGFSKRKNIDYFSTYVQKIAEEFSHEVSFILVLNEPNVYAGLSYGIGLWPPQKKNPITTIRVYRNLAHAHRKAYSLIKACNTDVPVGIAMALGQSYPVSQKNPVNHVVVWLKNYIWNWWFLNKIRAYQDFIGVNFYSATYLNWHLGVKDPNEPVNDLGWYMEPAALQDVLVKTWRRYHLPLLITENGLADSKDAHRQWWLEQTIDAMQKALDQGVILKGYLHWSLLDNFEWASGWWPKFGLLAVNRQTMKRSVRQSALWFAKRINDFH